MVVGQQGVVQAKESTMLDSIRKVAVGVPEVPTRLLVPVGTVVSFGWLLFQGKVHPLVIYCLELYLSF
jgi:hypothetical protein